ncbi:tetratricopeptide repeat protein 14-like [Acipenser ruthenus]|uniref:tetratricopeptide repeat protein 14-like n=1 Tax=Acipenser ruthenus TaxID=7906 RepID=UPI00274264E6|nr:tetratricopeptide repeat protein 14-like [Acipenser ruthenus]XP_034780674.2 tetratricopeptide repeat protein 14-like [Acipenser ruthenus]
MDRDILRQSVSYHGHTLFSLLKCEQQENPDFQCIAGDLSRTVQYRKERKVENVAIQQFIARKADLLFSPSWQSSTPLVKEETEDMYAVMPPLEQFMEVPGSDRRNLFFRDIECGDVVIGRINSLREFGFFVTLICLSGGLERYIEDLEITALCPLRDVPTHGNHDDPLSYYQNGDLIQAGVKDVDCYHEKLTVSLQPSSLPPSLSHLKLGVIGVDDMPAHYSRSVAVVSSTTETYETVLERTLGFANPSTVEFLLGKLGISETDPASLMRGLQTKNFLKEDYATSIRKKQSASWALKCVKVGVDHFKSGRHAEAMNEYNKGLEIDPNNVEALVARGALYATKGNLNKAIDDFELALESCPTHRNARKYLCQTLVQRGGQVEEEEKLVTAEGLYRKALALDEAFEEAEEALQKLQKHIQKSLKLKEEAAKEEKDMNKSVETSAEKLRKLLKEEKRRKRKRKRSSSPSDSLLSSSRKKSKKRKKRSVSSHRHKKRSHRSSSNEDKTFDSKESWYRPPANTSASFLNQKQDMAKLLEGNVRSVEQKSQVKGKRHNRSMSSSSVEILNDDGEDRSEDSIDSIRSAKFQAGSTKGKSQCSIDGDSRHHISKSRHRLSSGKEGELDHYSKRQVQASGIHQGLYGSAEKSDHRKNSSSSAGSEYSDKCGYAIRDSYSQDHSCSKNVESGDKQEEYKSREGVSKVKPKGEENVQSRGRLQNGKESAAKETADKNLPLNLLNIFSQIAQFEKEKCSKQKQ